MATRVLVLKFGGELIEDRIHLASIVAGVSAIVESGQSVVIVHGGGKEIDAALKAAGLEKKQVDGLRITDDAALDIVVTVLAGTVNTRLVAALNGAGVAAVGLTGADGNCGLSVVAPPHRSVGGRMVDLGRVGVPDAESPTRLLQTLVGKGFVPVVACIGVTRDGDLLNVNADTLAGHLAARLGARRLVIAGTTPGVLNEAGGTIGILEGADVTQLVNDGTATAGMIAKLRACEHALAGGVDDVLIVDGRDRPALVNAAENTETAKATRVIAETPAAPNVSAKREALAGASSSGGGVPRESKR